MKYDEDEVMDCEILGTRQLLENRTKASRGEIEMVETLEELKELNKRKVVVNYDGMLGQFEVQRQIELETEAARQEDEDEQVFARRHYTNSLSRFGLRRPSMPRSEMNEPLLCFWPPSTDGVCVAALDFGTCLTFVLCFNRIDH